MAIAHGQLTEEEARRVAELGGEIFAELKFPPNATPQYPLLRKFVEEGEYREEEFNLALQMLIEVGRVDRSGGNFGVDWYWRKPEPRIRVEDLSRDDIEWLTGTGYYSQG